MSASLTCASASRHENTKRSGLTDADAVTSGLQYRIDAGGASGDPFRVRLSDYEPGELPAAGDKVRVTGKVAVTKRRCEPNASLQDRYDAVNVRKVQIIDVD